MTKSEMAYKISMKNPHNAAGLYYNLMSKEEVLKEYNKYYGEQIRANGK